MGAEKDFEIGALVWAKMRSFPFWPAKVVSPPTIEEKSNSTPKGIKKKSSTARKAQHYVFFFGSENYAWILDENIVPHSEEMLNKVAKKKSASYVKAIEQIVEENKSIPQKPKPMVEDWIKNHFTKNSTAVQSPENLTPSMKVEELTKKSRVPKQKIKCEKKKSPQERKLPQKRKIPQRGPDKELLVRVRKLCRKKSDDYSPVASPSNIDSGGLSVIRPQDDRSIASRTYFNLPPGPSFNMTETSSILIEKNIIPTSKKIGFIGLGMMGQRMLKNLINSGHEVSIWNRTPEKCKPFVDYGAQQCLTPADVVSNCDITFCCVSGSEAAKSLVFENWGVLQGLENCQPGTKGYVEMTAMDPIISQEISTAIAWKGGKYLEAPVSNSISVAENSSLIVLAAGDPDLFNSCKTCFHAISKHAYYLSDEIGTALKMYHAVSMLMGTMYAALAEGMVLVERCNLSRSNFLEILDLGPMSCPLLLEKGHNIIENNFTTDTSLKYQQKDLQLGLQLGDKIHQPMVLVSAANELYKHAKLLRYSEHDVSAVYLGAKY